MPALVYMFRIFNALMNSAVAGKTAFVFQSDGHGLQNCHNASQASPAPVAKPVEGAEKVPFVAL